EKGAGNVLRHCPVPLDPICAGRVRLPGAERHVRRPEPARCCPPELSSCHRVYLILVVAMLAAGILGYRSGLGGGRSLVGSILLALVISLVVLIILDFDHPYHGLTLISQQGMDQLRQRMGNSP